MYMSITELSARHSLQNRILSKNMTLTRLLIFSCNSNVNPCLVSRNQHALPFFLKYPALRPHLLHRHWKPHRSRQAQGLWAHLTGLRIWVWGILWRWRLPSCRCSPGGRIPWVSWSWKGCSGLAVLGLEVCSLNLRMKWKKMDNETTYNRCEAVEPLCFFTYSLSLVICIFSLHCYSVM